MTAATARTQRPDTPASAASARLIDLSAESHRRDIDQVRSLLRDLQDEVAKIKRERLGAIRAATAQARASRQRLADATVADPAALGGNKTIILHDIRVGWRKDKDALAIPNPTGTVAAIRGG
jgi:hypothetical protein